MIYNNEFACPDGHAFKANAKLRARCPDCGKMAKRSFTSKEVTPSTSVEGGNPPELSPSTPTTEKSGIQLIRRGKPRSVPLMVKRATPPKGKDGKFLSSKKTVKRTASKPPFKSGGVMSNKLVRKHTVSSTSKKPAMPKITGRPKKTAVARHVGGSNQHKSYADEMIESYGFRR